MCSSLHLHCTSEKGFGRFLFSRSRPHRPTISSSHTTNNRLSVSDYLTLVPSHLLCLIRLNVGLAAESCCGSNWGMSEANWNIIPTALSFQRLTLPSFPQCPTVTANYLNRTSIVCMQSTGQTTTRLTEQRRDVWTGARSLTPSSCFIQYALHRQNQYTDLVHSKHHW